MRYALPAAVAAALAVTAQAGARETCTAGVRETCTAGVRTSSGVTHRTFTAKDGTFVNQAVGWQFPNGAHNALFHAKIKLTGGRKHGTFTGTTLADRKPGSGTFSC